MQPKYGKDDTLVTLLDDALKRHSSRTACIHLGHRIRYDELDEYASQWAYWLQSLELPRGSRVGIMLPNVAATLVATIGTLRAGHVVVNINPLFTTRELTAQLRDSGCEVIVIFEAFARTLQAVETTWQPPHQVVVAAGDLLPTAKGWLVNMVARHVQRKVPAWQLPQAIRFLQALRAGEQQQRTHTEPLPTVEPQDLAFLQYTGGTTGEPRGVMLTQANVLANVLQVHAVSRPALGHMDGVPLNILTALPLYHIFAMTVCGLHSLYEGMTIVLVLNARELGTVVKAWSEHPPALFAGVNTLFNALLQHPKFRHLDFSGLHLTFGGGMAVQVAVATAWRGVTGSPIVQGYGMSETSPVISAVPTDSTRFHDSVGLPLEDTELRIVDETTSEPVAPGESGEVAVRGPQVMAGYWNRPQETQEVMLSDGFFLTGDIGRIDENGFLVLIDRKKDMILVSGFNVFPAEIDAVFARHPGVLECAAVGLPDAVSGEVPWLFVVPRDDSLTQEALQQWAREQLTPYKRPRTYVFVDSLPKNAVGKTLRRLLRDRYGPKV